MIKTDGLTEIVRYLYEVFPSLERVTSYGRAKTVLSKKPDELRRLREAGLTRLHLGLETGDDEVLRRVKKGATAQEMIEAGRKAKEAGFELSEYEMPGLGGKGASQQHVQGTARVLNAIDPHYIRMRSLMLVPGTPLWDEYVAGEFEPLSRYEVVAEIGALIEGLEVTSRVCFDHIANRCEYTREHPGRRDKEHAAHHGVSEHQQDRTAPGRLGQVAAVLALVSAHQGGGGHLYAKGHHEADAHDPNGHLVGGKGGIADPPHENRKDEVGPHLHEKLNPHGET